MESHYSILQIEKIIFKSVTEANLQIGSYIPFLCISNKAKERHSLSAADLLKGYLSLQDKGLITNHIEIASGFFDYFHLKH